jgi:DNA-binding transcriptional MerR regulator
MYVSDQKEVRAMRNGMHIGELAEHFGLNPKTIRCYEEIGLLPRVERSESGYRLYDERDARRLGIIRRAKTLGLSLDAFRTELATLRAAWTDEDERVRRPASSACISPIIEQQTEVEAHPNAAECFVAHDRRARALRGGSRASYPDPRTASR